MDTENLAAQYREYVDCLNRRSWDELERFVHPEVSHNGRPFGLAGYRRMLEQDVATIPDLRFVIEIIVVEPPRVACRLAFDCSPSGTFMGVRVDGRRIRFAEHVTYAFSGRLIHEVWSVIDKAAIEAEVARV